MDVSRKKQLGQYFTDQRVGRLLASLANARSATSIIDPMVGSADLLQACLSVGAVPESLVGVELDPLAFDRAHSALEGVEGTNLILGDAFSTPLPLNQFDLVITNPPYIRYQSKADLEGISVPTSAQVRSGLIRAITSRTVLSAEDRALWLKVARDYPGTSDIAVPAWILSAALVREGGILAIVAPQAWLSRNYAQSVRTLLDAAFDVEVIVEDGDASWFEDAQVRTQLVVARRRSQALPRASRGITFARATRDLATDGDLRGTLRSEEAVAGALRGISPGSTVHVTTGLEARVERGFSLSTFHRGTQVSPRVAAVLGTGAEGIPVRTLDSYGWRTGQGLRSGANDFFYVSMIDGVVRPAARWGIGSLPFPSECLLPAVRRQSDLGDGYAVDESQLCSRIVSLRGWVTEADAKRMGPSNVQVLPTPVGRWIAQVASSPLSPKNPEKLFPDLTAVATNNKTNRSGQPVGFWYQLPALVPRHRPTLLIGRVCGGRPKTFLNSSGVVVDANFSGLWPVEPDALPCDALLALLNSSWAWANLEAACTVLGGGALKVEATDLRRLVLPDLPTAAVERLTDLGRLLVQDPSSSITELIDQVVTEVVMHGNIIDDHANALRIFAEQALQHRSRDESLANSR